MFGNLKGKFQGKSIDSEIDEAFDTAGTNSTGNDSYSQKVLEGSQKQNSRFGMSDAYFHEKPEAVQQHPTESQDFTQSSDTMPGQPAAEMPNVDFPSSNDLRISDPTRMDDPHLSVPAPKMLPPLLAQQPAQNQPMQQSIQQTQQQPQQMTVPKPLPEPQPIAIAQSPADANPLSRRVESLLLEVRTLRAQNEQILEVVRHLEKRSI
ncbi:MAG: hypothetical protein KAI53_03305 [Candidatus Aenigmarchaeota archaeon]|nr:hypothetical protein [Candidatus Aenigmarchaeota archaeon]